MTSKWKWVQINQAKNRQPNTQNKKNCSFHSSSCPLQVVKSSEETLLLKLRNPWGFVEYRGPWSDRWGCCLLAAAPSLRASSGVNFFVPAKGRKSGTRWTRLRRNVLSWRRERTGSSGRWHANIFFIGCIVFFFFTENYYLPCRAVLILYFELGYTRISALNFSRYGYRSDISTQLYPPILIFFSFLQTDINIEWG